METNGNLAVDMPLQEFIKAPALSKTGLKEFMKSPMHYKHYKEHGTETTDAMLLGSTFHCLTLEPSRFERQFVIWEGATRSGKKYEAFCEEHQNREVTTRKMYNEALAMARAVRLHYSGAELIEAAKHIEIPTFADLAGVRCKTKIDLWTHHDLIVELKSAKDASPMGFKKAIYNLNYHIEAGFTLDIAARAIGLDEFQWGFNRFVFLVVENKPPYAVAAYRPLPDVVDLGRSEYRMYLDYFNRCLENDNWPGYSPFVEELSLPRWAKKREGFYE